jgi:hypothetical protein
MKLRSRVCALVTATGMALACALPASAFAQPAELTVTSEPVPLTVYRLRESAETLNGVVLPPKLERLCVTPCRTNLQAGAYQFAFGARGNGIKVPTLTLGPGAAKLAVEYQDRSSKRVLGLGLMAAGAAAGSLLLFAASNAEERDPALVGVGIGTIAAGIASGMTIFILNPDRVQVVRQSLRKSSKLSVPSGLALQGRF